MFEANRKAFQTQAKSLLTNIEGRRIVADEKHLIVVEPLIYESRISDALIASWSAQLEELSKPLQSEGVDFSAESLAEISADLEMIAGQLQVQVDQLQRDQELLTHILRDTASRAPGNEILLDALAKRKRDLEAQRAAEVASARREAEEETTRRLKEEETRLVEAEAQVRIQNAEKQRIAQEQTAARLKREKEEEMLVFAAAQAKAKLLQEMQRDMPQIRALLQPFLTPGSTQLGRQGFEVTTTKAPISFSSIQASGALEDSMSGLKALHALGAHERNGRPTGAFPSPYFDTFVYRYEATRNTVQRAQQLLIKYGELLVEKELLSP